MVDIPELDNLDLQKQALAKTVQVPPEVSKNGAISANLSWGMYARGSFLPAWGTRERERSLNLLWHMDEMALIRGAVSGICKNIATTPWEIKGDDTPSPMFREMGKERGFSADNGVEYYQQVLRLSDFGAGWGSFISKLAMGFFRFDAGGFAEVIAPGDPYGEVTGAITGLAYLDPLRVLPTGDPRYPALYYDRQGGMHIMHHTRIIQLQDMPQGDESAPGYGDCALSRAVSIAYRQIWTARYINAYLDDQPKPGILAVSGITKQSWDDIETKYQNELERDTMSKWGRVIRYHSAGANVEAKFQFESFSEAPEKFSFREYMEIDVDLLALVMGVDRQELWQLSGGNIGSAEQSAILHQKSRGKTIGYLITELERKINDLLPVDYEFMFKYRDESEALQEAQKANLWADFTSKTTTLLNPQEGKTLLNNQVEAVKDAISNAPRVNDLGVQPQTTITAPDDTVGAEDAPVAVDAAEPPARLVDPADAKALSDAKKKYNPNQPREDDGKFGSGGGGGIVAAAGVAVDSSGQPEYMPAAHGKPYVKNPYYSGKPSGKPAPDAPGKKPSGKPADKPASDKPDKKPEADKPTPTAPKPAAGKKPEWANPKRKPGVDSEGYQDFTGMDNDTQATNRAYELSDSHTQALSKKQTNAAKMYTGESYHDINGGLRSGKVPADYQATVRELDSAISQSKLPENTVLYRGMSMSPELSSKIKPGATFSDSAYTSTSINPRIPASFARGEGKTMMRIKAKKGQSGLAVNNVSNYDGEHEVLLPRGTSYRVTNVYKDKKTGMTYVDAEIVGEAA